MLRVFADAGLAVRRRLVDDVIELTMPIPRAAALGADSAYLDAVAGREQRADVASLAPLLAPRSVAVVGAGRREGSIGRTILLNIRDAGFAGALFAVNPHAEEIEGVPCRPSVADLPTVPDLAVVAVPPAQVSKVARECGKRGVRSLVVITSGLGVSGDAHLLETCRQYGMRLVGPNCFGVAVPGVGLDATFAVRHPQPGTAGLVVQSGGVGIALLEHFSRLGIGISSFASVGDKMDVSGNDLLMWWEQDGLTKLAVLYLESFGSPRKFARTARRVSAHIPVLTVHAGRSAPGQRAAASHTAAVAAPLITRQALFEQAGIIATSSLGALLDTAVLLANQPIPAGRRVAIVTNAGGAGVLAADACVEAGLSVARTSARTQERLRRLLPYGAAVGGPVDTTAGVGAQQFRDCLLMVADQAPGDQDPPDAVIALTVPTAASDLVPALREVRLLVPLAAVVLDQSEAVRTLPAADGGAAVPAYAYPEGAAGALGRAARYSAWRSRPAGTMPEFADIRPDDARVLVESFLGRLPGGGWLSPAEADELLRCYGIPVVDSRYTVGAEQAIEAAAALGGQVALKADVPGLVHKSDAGAVELGVRGPADVRRALRRLEGRFGDRLSGVLVQAMIPGGTETIIGVVQEPVFGPLVVFGLGGIATEVLGDHAARLAPLTDTDADDLIHAIRAAPLLLGHRGQPAADLGALRDMLLRISRLADDLPQVAELDLNPVIARPDGVFAVDVRARVTSHGAADPFLRQLRMPPAATLAEPAPGGEAAQ
jgi:acyl-CoA synthetase (NDP forming)